jgi:hypothetical protein
MGSVNPRRRSLLLGLSFACLALSTVAVSTAWRIEKLNSAVGTYLPRCDFSEGGNNKWRQSPFTTEEWWRRRHLRNPDGTVDSRPLSNKEAEQMRTDIEREKNWNQLRFLVNTVGLLQYLLCPFAIIGSAVLFIKQESRLGRRLCRAACVASAIALGLAVYRGYFTALAW